MASTSTSTGTKYDVFLSFRGEDTRPNFTNHLFAALERKFIKTFIDDKLGRGEEISSALLQTIKQSKISVIIFSKDYANSRWCLEELAYIMKCKGKNKDQIVLPIFYDVDPSDVRNQSGTFGEGFGMVKEEFKDNLELVQKWSTALTEAADLSGWTSSNRLESDLIEEVAEHIKELCPITYTASPGIVGIDWQFEQIIPLLRLDQATDGVHAVGIWGMGGIGKTTIAERISGHISNKFDRICVFRDVREKSEKLDEVHLLKSFFSQLLGDETSKNIQMVSVLPTDTIDKLSKMKVLVVLDDVNHPKHLEVLLTHVPYRPGSRIIVTSRDKRALLNGVHEIYKMKGLYDSNALQLLSMKAFKEMHPPKEYEELSKRAVKYAGGVPLALQVLGSNLRSKLPKDWEMLFEKLEKSPEADIQKILK